MADEEARWELTAYGVSYLHHPHRLAGRRGGADEQALTGLVSIWAGTRGLPAGHRLMHLGHLVPGRAGTPR